MGLKYTPILFIPKIKNMAKELTPEEMAAKLKALEAENKSLKKENAAKTKDLMKVNKEVPGTFELDGKTYKFKTGFLKFNLAGKVHNSEEAIKDAELMTKLVELGFGGIEEVKSK